MVNGKAKTPAHIVQISVCSRIYSSYLQVFMKIDYTQILAIYGAVISTIVLLLRFRDRSDKKRKLLIRIDRYVNLNDDQYNYHSGRKGDQFLRIRITNKSANPNSIENVDIFSTNRILGLNFQTDPIDLNFNHRFELPFGLDYSGLAQGFFYLNMNTLEFNKSWDSNYQVLKKLDKSHLFVIVTDTHGKKYKSNILKIKELLNGYLREEKKLVTDSYYKENYVEKTSR